MVGLSLGILISATNSPHLSYTKSMEILKQSLLVAHTFYSLTFSPSFRIVRIPRGPVKYFIYIFMRC